MANRTGPDGYCDACAAKLKASEEWEPPKDDGEGEVPP